MRRKIIMIGLCLAMLMNTMIVAYAADVTAEPDVSQYVMSAEDLLNATNYMQTSSYGTVSGNITYTYNRYRGSVADTKARVILVSKGGAGNLMPDEPFYTWESPSELNEVGNAYGVYSASVDGTGSYTISHVPVGEYVIFIESHNATSGTAFDDYDAYKAGISSKFYSLLSDSNCYAISQFNNYYKYYCGTITVYENETTTVSYDFGTTYI